MLVWAAAPDRRFRSSCSYRNRGGADYPNGILHDTRPPGPGATPDGRGKARSQLPLEDLQNLFQNAKVTDGHNWPPSKVGSKRIDTLFWAANVEGRAHDA